MRGEKIGHGPAQCVLLGALTRGAVVFIAVRR